MAKVAEDRVRLHLLALRDRSKLLKEGIEFSELPENFFEQITVRLSDGKSVKVARGFLILGLKTMEKLKAEIIREAAHGQKYAREMSV